MESQVAISLLLGAVGLLLLRSMFVRADTRARWALPLMFVAGFAVITTVGARLLRYEGWLPDTTATRVAKGALVDLRHALRDPALRTIVFIDGGSYPARGLNGERLEQDLARATGGAVAVIQMSLPGANHFERLSMYDEFVGLLSRPEIEAIRTKKVVLMLERQAGYDQDPLAQFEKNRHTDRAYGYLTPVNAWDAFRAWRMQKAPDAREAAAMLGDLVNHAGINAINVGYFSRHVPVSDQAVLVGYQPMRVPAGHFRYRGMAGVMKHFERSRRESAQPLPAWLDAVLLPRVRAVFAPLAPQFVYYTVPSLNGAYVRYAHDACSAAGGIPCIDYGDPVLLQALDAAQYWYDNGHMLPEGAAIYTDWLAARLAPHLGSNPGATR